MQMQSVSTAKEYNDPYNEQKKREKEKRKDLYMYEGTYQQKRINKKRIVHCDSNALLTSAHGLLVEYYSNRVQTGSVFLAWDVWCVWMYLGSLVDGVI